jgi:hypothetical protein
MCAASLSEHKVGKREKQRNVQEKQSEFIAWMVLIKVQDFIFVTAATTDNGRPSLLVGILTRHKGEPHQRYLGQPQIPSRDHTDTLRLNQAITHPVQHPALVYSSSRRLRSPYLSEVPTGRVFCCSYIMSQLMINIWYDDSRGGREWRVGIGTGEEQGIE